MYRRSQHQHRNQQNEIEPGDDYPDLDPSIWLPAILPPPPAAQLRVPVPLTVNSFSCSSESSLEKPLVRYIRRRKQHQLRPHRRVWTPRDLEEDEETDERTKEEKEEEEWYEKPRPLQYYTYPPYSPEEEEEHRRGQGRNEGRRIARDKNKTSWAYPLSPPVDPPIQLDSKFKPQLESGSESNYRIQPYSEYERKACARCISPFCIFHGIPGPIDYGHPRTRGKKKGSEEETDAEEKAREGRGDHNSNHRRTGTGNNGFSWPKPISLVEIWSAYYVRLRAALPTVPRPVKLR
jgi:hypothetical protein